MENNWSIQQTKKLFEYVKVANEKSKGLVWAFSKMSDESGKSINSVRNYYYSQLKMFELVPNLASDLGIQLIESNRAEFELFSESEIKGLVETILIEKAKGKSVRATIAELSSGDEKKALRLQNKYRSMITHHKEKVGSYMKDLSAKGTVYFNPFTKKVVTEEESKDSHLKLAEFIANLDESEVDNVFSIIKKLFA